MNRNLALRGLWWKELRQLVPLVGLLVLVGVLLQVLAVLLPFGNRIPWREAAALLGMPGLFAAGVGALLIGQEKETRTLDWLRSLPLAASDLVRTKLLVALLGLTIVWTVSLVLGWATDAWTMLRDGHGGEWIWPLHSVFLLLVGFATAWQARSSMLALLLVVPLACLPLFFAGIHQSIREWRGTGWWMLDHEPEPWVMALYLILFGIGFAWYGWRAGLAYCAPESAPRFARERSSSAAANYQSSLSYARIAPAPALLWQFLAQNRGLLMGLIALQVASFFVHLPLAILGSLLAVSWLGVMVFQADVPQRRVVFLADRGVSPRLVWLTRQVIPLSVLVLILVAIGTFQLPIEMISSQLFDTTTLTLLTALFLCVYLSTQWLGQLTTSPIVSSISAPLLGLAVVGYFVYCAIELEASWWSIGLALLVPLVATWWGKSDWMDRRSDRWMWGRHASLFVLFLLLPVSSFLYLLGTYPSMSSETRRELLSIANHNLSFFGGPLELTAWLDADDERALEGDSGTLVKEKIRLALSKGSTAISTSNYPLACLTAAMRLRLDEQSEVDQSNRKAVVEDYRQWLQLLLELHDRLRLSWRLMEQDQADVIEIWLVEELKASGARERLGSDLLDQMNAIFSNDTARQTARRRAIALSWRFARDQQFGGYQFDRFSNGYVTTKDVWEASRAAQLVSELLLKSLDAKAGEQAVLRGQIGELMGRGARANHEWTLDAPNGVRQLLYYETVINYFPGTFWNGAWEREGAELVKEMLDARD